MCSPLTPHPTRKASLGRGDAWLSPSPGADVETSAGTSSAPNNRHAVSKGIAACSQPLTQPLKSAALPGQRCMGEVPSSPPRTASRSRDAPAFTDRVSPAQQEGEDFSPCNQHSRQRKRPSQILALRWPPCHPRKQQRSSQGLQVPMGSAPLSPRLPQVPPPSLPPSSLSSAGPALVSAPPSLGPFIPPGAASSPFQLVALSTF